MRKLARRRSWTVLLSLAATCHAPFVAAQDPAPPAFIAAQRAEVAGDFRRAEELYGQVLERQPEHTAARMGRARMRSWLRRFDEAIEDYRAVVRGDPSNVEARSGLGWTLGWDGQYEEARRVFDYLLTTEPYYLDAQKGTAYIELWSGNAGGARRWFEALSREDRNNPDYKLAIAQAAYLQGDFPASIAAYREAIALKPDFEAARTGLRAAQSAALERRPQLTILAGRSEAGGVEQTGVRVAQLGAQLNREPRLWLGHDRGVGFDGFAVDRRAKDAATTTAGAFWTYQPRLAARFEVGMRDLLDEEAPIVAVEQVFFLPRGTTPKLGFWWADSDVGSEWVANAGVHYWVTPRFAIEPTAYVGRSGETREFRAAVLGTFRIGPRSQIGLGYAAGNKDEPPASRPISSRFVARSRIVAHEALGVPASLAPEDAAAGAWRPKPHLHVTVLALWLVAVVWFHPALALEALHPVAQQSTLLTLASLHATQNQHQKTIDAMREWFRYEATPSAEAHVLVANAYVQLKKPGSAPLAMGIARTELGDYGDALRLFERAANDEATSRQAAPWIAYTRERLKSRSRS